MEGALLTPRQHGPTMLFCDPCIRVLPLEGKQQLRPSFQRNAKASILQVQHRGPAALSGSAVTSVRALPLLAICPTPSPYSVKLAVDKSCTNRSSSERGFRLVRGPSCCMVAAGPHQPRQQEPAEPLDASPGLFLQGTLSLSRTRGSFLKFRSYWGGRPRLSGHPSSPAGCTHSLAGLGGAGGVSGGGGAATVCAHFPVAPAGRPISSRMRVI